MLHNREREKERKRERERERERESERASRERITCYEEVLSRSFEILSSQVHRALSSAPRKNVKYPTR